MSSTIPAVLLILGIPPNQVYPFLLVVLLALVGLAVLVLLAVPSRLFPISTYLS